MKQQKNILWSKLNSAPKHNEKTQKIQKTFLKKQKKISE